MDDARRQRLRVQTERWFVRQGLPQVIADYSVKEDVLTRMVPALGFVFMVELVVALFGDRHEGWQQFLVFVAGSTLAVVGIVAANRARGRRPLQRPDDVGPYEIATFVVVPVALALLADGSWREAAAIAAINLGILGLTYVVAYFGLLPMLWFGAVQLLRRLQKVSRLFGRSLPVLLLFVTIIFLTAEVWQVAHDFTPLFYLIGVGSIFLVALGFVALRAPTEVAGLGTFAAWDEVVAQVDTSTSPLAGQCHPYTPAPAAVPLSQATRRNVGLLLTTSYVVQVVVVGTVIGVFFLFFGLFAIREESLLQFTTQSAEELDPLFTVSLAGDEMILTWEHLAVAGFVAAFSALQFAVQLLTDPEYRAEFYADVSTDIRQVLAVRVAYLQLLVDPPPRP